MGEFSNIELCLDIGYHNHFLDGGKVFEDVLNPLQTVESLAVVKIAISGEKYLGFDLSEPVQYPFDAEVRRT